MYLRLKKGRSTVFFSVIKIQINNVNCKNVYKTVHNLNCAFLLKIVYCSYIQQCQITKLITVPFLFIVKVDHFVFHNSNYGFWESFPILNAIFHPWEIFEYGCHYSPLGELFFHSRGTMLQGCHYSPLECYPFTLWVTLVQGCHPFPLVRGAFLAPLEVSSM